MTSSARKKKEKKKDFQKAKLKVGKTKAKPDSFTATSFKAKSVVLNQQSLATSAPSLASQFDHHLSLLKHRSDSQRRDSLAYLTSAIASRSQHDALPQPLSTILSKVQPLMLDASGPVRQQLNKFLRALPPDGISSEITSLNLRIRAGMTHLATDIRSTSLDAFIWLLEVANQELVTSAGVWVKTLKCFLGLLGWTQQQESTGPHAQWSSIKVTARDKPSGGTKLFVKQLQALTMFVDAGIGKHADEKETPQGQTFPLWCSSQHLLPTRSNVYGYLNLFGPARDEESETYGDRSDRQRIFRKLALPQIEDGLEQARREGGEVGRAAAALRRAVEAGMRDFVNDEG
ncbi:MAG: hypothetical protein M1820_002976 [Bogoriella megaspora]|nr:MAG: hypothetical protein M1820_002976 [Bogoriella megaspora]